MRAEPVCQTCDDRRVSQQVSQQLFKVICSKCGGERPGASFMEMDIDLMVKLRYLVAKSWRKGGAEDQEEEKKDE